MAKFKAAWNKWKRLPLSVQASWILLDITYLWLLICFPLFLIAFSIMIAVILAMCNVIDWSVDISRRRDYYRNLKGQYRDGYYDR